MSLAVAHLELGALGQVLFGNLVEGSVIRGWVMFQRLWRRGRSSVDCARGMVARLGRVVLGNADISCLYDCAISVLAILIDGGGRWMPASV